MSALNSKPAQFALAQLPRLALLQVNGADAASFLQRQLSSNILKLAPDALGLGCYSSAKGMVYSNFYIVRTADGFLLRLAAEVAAQVRARLSMFVLRDAVQITIADMQVLGLIGAGSAEFLRAMHLPVPAAGEVCAWQNTYVLSSKLQAGAPRYEIYCQTPSALEAKLNAAADDYMLSMLQSGEVLIETAAYEQYVAQQLNLDLLGAIDFKKGCYPGQEYIARTQYRGKVRSRTAYLRANCEQHGARQLFASSASDIAIGSIINRENHHGSCHILAAVRLKNLLSQAVLYSEAGCEFSLQPLPYALDG